MAGNEPVTDPDTRRGDKREAVIEYDCRKPLDPRQQLFLDRMDLNMDSGISLDGHQESQPDFLTRHGSWPTA
ncbi:MAG TPA: hypothetical protein VJ437_04780 [Acidiferrobacterales bacterium]|nr:hypothetical protein [Acidiferrobacterales bacterium]